MSSSASSAPSDPAATARFVVRRGPDVIFSGDVEAARRYFDRRLRFLGPDTGWSVEDRALGAFELDVSFERCAVFFGACALAEGADGHREQPTRREGVEGDRVDA